MFTGGGASRDDGMSRSSRGSHQPGKDVPERVLSAGVLL